jgi:hypothetical protein
VDLVDDQHTPVARIILTAMSCLVASRSFVRSGAPNASRIAEKNRLSSGAGGICTLSTGTRIAPSRALSSEPGRCSRLNFSTIIVLPLLLGPTSNRFGIRVRFGNESRSSSAARATDRITSSC